MSDPANLRRKLRSTAEELEQDMKRAECKGRTLCLKIKLHTFEVLTRQLVVPRAICLADDLYNYALPMLAKLEQEMPGMKLRLMGLRCSHLVNTKKPDTMAFFGFRDRKATAEAELGPGASKRKLVEGSDYAAGEDTLGGEEAWFEEVDRTIGPDLADDANSFDAPVHRRHGKEIVPNPIMRTPVRQEEWWGCPICLRPQSASERQFNEHVDLCLSRPTIRDAVQGDEPQRAPECPGIKRLKTAERRRGGPSASDPKQKKLSFG